MIWGIPSNVIAACSWFVHVVTTCTPACRFTLEEVMGEAETGLAERASKLARTVAMASILGM